MLYRVLIRLPNGATTWVSAQGSNIGQARSLAEAQYGSDRVLQIVNA